jgi:hypothetical protein
MKELAAAITTRFNATNSLKTALTGQLYPYEAAQAATFPYGVYYFIDENTDYGFSDEQRDIYIQFSLFSEGSSPGQAFTLGGYAETLFDNAKMTLTGFDLLQFKRTGSRLMRDEEMNTYTFILEYHAIIERGR